jgi:hypothetical protein
LAPPARRDRQRDVGPAAAAGLGQLDRARGRVGPAHQLPGRRARSGEWRGQSGGLVHESAG